MHIASTGKINHKIMKCLFVLFHFYVLFFVFLFFVFFYGFDCVASQRSFAVNESTLLIGALGLILMFSMFMSFRL